MASPPMQSIHIQTALGRYIKATTPGAMQQAFAQAATHLAKENPAEVKEKFPELESMAKH